MPYGDIVEFEGIKYEKAPQEVPDSCQGCHIPHRGNFECAAGKCLTAPYSSILKFKNPSDESRVNSPNKCEIQFRCLGESNGRIECRFFQPKPISNKPGYFDYGTCVDMIKDCKECDSIWCNNTFAKTATMKAVFDVS